MDPPSRLRRLDAWCAVWIAAVALLTYWLTRQGWLYGDGAEFVDRFVRLVEGAPLRVNMHALYYPTGWLVESMIPGYRPLAALELVSAGSGAAALGGAFLVARAYEVPRPSAIAAAALLGVTPAYWFFATTIEVHSLHAAGVTLAASVTVFAPWRRVGLAVGLSALAFPLTFATHQSGALLGPAWVLLAALARRRATGQSFRWPGLLFGVGATHLATLLITMTIADRFRASGSGDGMGIGSTLSFISVFYSGYVPGLFLEGLLYPLALLLPVVLLGLAGQRGIALGMQVAAIVPIALFFFFVFGDPTEGGYFLGLTPFLVLLAGRAFTAIGCSDKTWRGVAIVTLLLVGQTAVGLREVRFSGREHRATDRAARGARWHAALPDGGTVITLDPTHQSISGMFAGLRELNAMRTLQEIRRTWPAARAAAALRSLRDFPKPLVFDLDYAAGLRNLPEIRAYADALVASLRRDPAIREVLLGSRPVLWIAD